MTWTWNIGVTTVVLTSVWLLLLERVSLGGVLLGASLSLVAALVTRQLSLPSGRLRRPAAAVELAFMVLSDIIRSNIAVARIILGLGSKKRSSDFLRIPLEMRTPYGLAVLACIITATPGTIWVAYDPTRNSLLLHILDLVDDQFWIDTIKGRYESRLREIFE